MAKKKALDQLTQWALEAADLGMRYGDYVAKFHPPQPIPERYPKKHGDGEKQCQYCGTWFLSEHQGRKYCGKVCAAKAREEQKRVASAARLAGDNL